MKVIAEGDTGLVVEADVGVFSMLPGPCPTQPFLSPGMEATTPRQVVRARVNWANVVLPH